MRRPLLVMGSLFLLGETAFRLLDEYPLYSVAACTASLIIMIICNSFKLMDRKSLNLLLFLCFVSGVLWGCGYYHIGNGSGRAVLEKGLASGEGVSIEGVVRSAEPASDGYKLRITSGGEKVIVYVDAELSGELSDNLSDGNEIEQGRRIRITGKVENIKKSTNPGEMDMEQYYLGQGIRYQIKCDSYRLLKGGNPVLLYLGRLRRAAGIILDNYYSDENSAIMKTMLLGDKTDLNKDTRLLYQRSGIAHILAISGLHIALIAGIIELLLIRIGIRRNTTCIIESVILVIYGIMTGMSQATMRAVLMIIVMKSAYILKRTPDPPTSMIEALIIMMIINPDSIFSTGMLMSFGAILGIWTGEVFYQHIFGKERFTECSLRTRKLIRKTTGTLIMAISINVWMLPLIILNYYEVPVFSMLLNLVVTFLLSIVIVLGFVVILLGFIIGSILRAVFGNGFAFGNGVVLGNGFVFGDGFILENGTAPGNMGGDSFAEKNVMLDKACGFGKYAGVWICRLLSYIVRGAALISSVILDFYNHLCKAVVGMRGSVIITGHLEVWGVIIYYVIVTMVLLFVYYSRGADSISPFSRLRTGIRNNRKAGLYRIGKNSKFGKHDKNGKSGKSGKCGKNGKSGKNKKGVGVEKSSKNEEGGKNNKRNMDEQCGKNEKNSRAEKSSKNEKGGNNEKTKNADNDLRKKFLYMAGYILLGLILNTGLIVTVYLCNYSKSQVVFLDVGQGDGSIIRTSFRKNYIMDAGSSNKSELGRYTLIPALKYYGMTEIEAVFVSHMDSDHMNAVLYLLQNQDKYGIRVRNVVVAEGTSASDNYDSIIKAVNMAEDTKLLELKEGQIVDGCFRVLYPEGITEGSMEGSTDGIEEGSSEGSLKGNVEGSLEGGVEGSLEGGVEGSLEGGVEGSLEGGVEGSLEGDVEGSLEGDVEGSVERGAEGRIEGGVEGGAEGSVERRIEGDVWMDSEEHDGNDYSLVIDYTDNNLEVLYTGDIGQEVEKNIIDDISSLPRRRLRILKCAHHGSKYSSSKEFLDAFSPDVTVISCGKNNRYGHPSPETMDRLEQKEIIIYRTDMEGAIIIQN